MLIELQSMWGGHIGSISDASPRIYLVSETAKLVFSVSHQAGPKSGEFKKIGIETLSFQMMIVVAQAE